MRTLTAALRLAALALWLALPLHAASAGTATLSSLAQHVAQHPVVRAEFTQTRQMAALKRPVVTTGRIVYSREHGVLWQIEKPYAMTYVLQDDKVVEIGADGQRRERQVQGLAEIGRVFRAVLSADTQALASYFDIAVQGTTAQWTLELKPRQPQMAQVMERIRITGDQFVQTLRMDEAGGDSTSLRFRGTQGADALSDAELQRFNGVPRTP
ncbi:hypothetical protein C8246_08095 [Paracidovorax avenae]|uniref:outer membrane lipoprotein carrier protein LolA n=1 Tax=Paracidovorax avenae TaxID=80867 RepID=UPI000D226504|nr:outer membrane lipoprotein carrier protein LolA [Paracidovorax avenae]AVS84399.1 hypothetical protein C8239_06115 [Paracidovorax avenae]AVS91751.1 hypothetical protein C8246_08095 [Paracidovorax avenae]AVT05529.1 hypothetical protein C8248_05675 [Paracidovorax avenae]